MSIPNPVSGVPEWFCDCIRRCKGVRKKVSERTWYHHANDRNQVAITFAQFVGRTAVATPATSPPSPPSEHVSRKHPANEYEDQSANQPRLCVEEGMSTTNEPIEDIKIAQEFIAALCGASLANDALPADVLECLCHPPQELPGFDDPILRLSMKTYLALTNASQESYHRVRQAMHDEIQTKLLSFSQVKSQIAELSGVVPIVHDMCVNTFIAFTGPYSDCDTCPMCKEPHYDQHKLQTSRGRIKKPRKVFHTMPLGPQLQACRRHPEMAEKMQYRHQRMEELLAEIQETGDIAVYDNLYCGTDLLAAVENGQISSSDSVLLFSIDGAQLYPSDCWMYLWILLDLSPDTRYKKAHILPGGIIPGPNKPKNLDSFLFPGLHHLAALQKEGLRVWDAAKSQFVIDHPFLAFITADTPGMTQLNETVGHHGRLGCRFYCKLIGRRKVGGSQYYPACLKPSHYSVVGCDHPDVILQEFDHETSEVVEQRYLRNLHRVCASRTQAEYKRNCLETGICKPTLFSSLPDSHCLRIPACFPGDLMHLASLNLTDLLLGLWQGVIDCDTNDSKASWDWFVLHGDVWKSHGMAVASARPYPPGSFDRPPRNPAEKISSGYKAWEFLTYVFGYCPAMLYGILPDKYWRNFCKLVMGIRLLHQHQITMEELKDVHRLLIEFCEEFEVLYYQRLPSRLHFCRQSVHQMRHAAPESWRTGLLALTTQWPMERLIGDLGQEIRQPSNPFANLSQRGLLCAQVNALKYYLKATSWLSGPGSVTPSEMHAIQLYLQGQGHHSPVAKVVRWAHLRLPNGQVARSAWKESSKPLSQVRMARNVKVQYYFQLQIDGEDKNLAMVSFYGPPDAALLAASLQTVWSCQYQGDAGMAVVDIKSICSVVAMVLCCREDGSGDRI
ncbi:hypothetical protein DENSPDRAFT_861874 [Dentipellis sp. KUC8613]|nr:hypothetical protein DENSPDRAFT_861874 [Dentipellis sp. KUC8613]